MKETKGLVIKITEKFMVVVYDDGKFRNLPLPKKVPSVGERITVPLRQKKRISFSWLSTVAACLFIFLGLTLWLQMQPKYYHVAVIDINPNLELYLDSEGRVIEAKPLNPDAEKVLNNFPLEKLTLHDAIEQVLTKSIALGYINKEKENIIMIAVARLRGGSVINSNSIESVVTKTLQSEHINGVLKVEQTDKSLYDKSKEKNLSLNKWILTQQAEQLGIQLNFEKAASESVVQVLQKAGISKEQFFVPIRIPTNQEKDEQKKIEQTFEKKNRSLETSQETKNPMGSSSDKIEGSTFPSDSTKNEGWQQKQTPQTPTQDSNKNTYPTGTSGTSQSTGTDSFKNDSSQSTGTNGYPNNSYQWPLGTGTQDSTNSTSTPTQSNSTSTDKNSTTNSDSTSSWGNW